MTVKIIAIDGPVLTGESVNPPEGHPKRRSYWPDGRLIKHAECEGDLVSELVLGPARYFTTRDGQKAYIAARTCDPFTREESYRGFIQGMGGCSWRLDGSCLAYKAGTRDKVNHPPLDLVGHWAEATQATMSGGVTALVHDDKITLHGSMLVLSRSDVENLLVLAHGRETK